MRIQEIKQLSDNPKVSRIFGYFWDMPDYQQAMWNFRSKETGAKGLLAVMVKVFARKYSDRKGELNHEARAQRDDLRSLAKLLYGDADMWCVNSDYEEIEREYKRRTAEKRSLTKERAEKLEALSDILGKDELGIRILFDIAGNDAQFTAVSTVLCDIKTAEELREICIGCSRKHGTGYGFRDEDKRLVGRLNDLISGK